MESVGVGVEADVVVVGVCARVCVLVLLILLMDGAGVPVVCPGFGAETGSPTTHG